MKRHRFTIYLAAAAIFAATITQAHAQEADPLAAAAKAAATPAPAAATTTAAPRSTPAPAAPRESMKDQLAHGHFVQAGELASMAGKKVPANVFLTGTFKASGNKAGGRTEFDADGTHVFVRFPTPPDPKLTAQGYSSRWEKAAPLRLERVETTPRGITAFCTDVTP